MVANNFTEISKSYSNFELKVFNLIPLTDYTAYIVGGSAHFGYPDLMSPNKIKKLKFRTEPAPEGIY
jgi:hypothetical protein